MTDIPVEFLGKPTMPQYGQIWPIPLHTSDRIRRFSYVLGAQIPTHRGSSAWLSDGKLNFSQIFGANPNYVSSPYLAAYNLANDADIRVLADCDNWFDATTKDLITRWQLNNCIFAFVIQATTGKLQFWMSADGVGANAVFAESTVAVPFAAYDKVWIRATRVRATGSVQFWYTYVANPKSADWIPIGDPVVLLAGTALFAGNAPMEIGSQGNGGIQYRGGMYRTQVRNNVLDDGTGIVFDADYEAAAIATPYATTMVPTVGNTVTVEVAPPTWLSNWTDTSSLMRQNGGLNRYTANGVASGLDPYIGQWAEWWLPIPGRSTTGQLHLWTSALKGPNIGIQRLSIDGVTIGADVDLYQASTWAWTASYFFVGDVGSTEDAKLWKLRWTLTGKNAAASAQFACYHAYTTLYTAT